MSNWTHVAGVIRIIRNFNTEPDFDKLIGKECLNYKDYFDMRNNPNDYMPFGWEGSLEKMINPDRDGSFGYVVKIFGDLRDYEDANHSMDKRDSLEEIAIWFKERCDKINKNYFIRNAVITIRDELYGDYTYTYSDE